jgi:hypothetical protein
MVSPVTQTALFGTPRWANNTLGDDLQFHRRGANAARHDTPCASRPSNGPAIYFTRFAASSSVANSPTRRANWISFLATFPVYSMRTTMCANFTFSTNMGWLRPQPPSHPWAQPANRSTGPDAAARLLWNQSLTEKKSVESTGLQSPGHATACLRCSPGTSGSPRTGRKPAEPRHRLARTRTSLARRSCGCRCPSHSLVRSRRLGSGTRRRRATRDRQRAPRSWGG